MRRYWQEEPNLLLLFPYYPSSTRLLPVEVMEAQYPYAWAYLNENREILEGRESGRWQGRPNWYGYSYRKNHRKFSTGSPRVLTPSIAPAHPIHMIPTDDFTSSAVAEVGAGGTELN
jgi:hypothetical protein